MRCSYNGVCEEREEPELSVLVCAHWKEDVNDEGRTSVAWLKLEDIVRELKDAELSVLDHYFQNNKSDKWEHERAALREHFLEAEPEAE